MIGLHFILNNYSNNNFSNKSLMFTHLFLIKYTKIKYLYLFLLISLAGLPPFLLFFIKTNYIISFIGTISFYMIFFIFLCYFVNMIYYTQLFIHRNSLFDDIDFVHMKRKKYNAVIVLNLIGLVVLMSFGAIFCCDIFFIGNLLFS